MEGISTADPVVLAQWTLPLDADVADRIAKAAFRARNPRARPILAMCGLMVVVLLGLALAGESAVIPVLFLVILFTGLMLRMPKMVARALRKGVGAAEPHAVTLDREGFHSVGRDEAVHLRWSQFQSATLDADGVLVLRHRGSMLHRGLVLDTLDPAVDRAWLLDAVQRAIAAQAP